MGEIWADMGRYGEIWGHLVRRADEAAERRGVIARRERLHVREVRLDRDGGS